MCNGNTRAGDLSYQEFKEGRRHADPLSSFLPTASTTEILGYSPVSGEAPGPAGDVELIHT